MLNTFFSSANRRIYILAAFAALLLIITLYNFVVPAVGELLPSQDEIDVKATKLEKFKEVLQYKGDAADQLKSMQQDLKRFESGLLVGKTQALAAVEAQKILTEITAKYGVSVTSMRVLATKENKEAPYQPVPVQLSINSDIRQLLNVLYAIQNSAKLLRPSDFSVRVAGSPQNDRMIITLTIEGFMKNS